MTMARSTTADLLVVLTHAVRLMSLAQVARTRFGHTRSPVKAARQFIRREERLGLLAVRTLMLHPEISVEVPIVTWRPGMPEPDFDVVAWRAQSRWREPPVATTVVQATAKSQALTGGIIGSRPIRQTEATHDLHCAAIYLHWRERTYEELEWIPEDEIASRRDYKPALLPDAIVGGNPPILIDFIGSYSARKLRAMHAASAEFPYHWY